MSKQTRGSFGDDDLKFRLSVCRLTVCNIRGGTNDPNRNATKTPKIDARLLLWRGFLQTGDCIYRAGAVLSIRPHLRLLLQPTYRLYMLNQITSGHRIPE